MSAPVDYLPSVIPEMITKRLTVDFEPGSDIPFPNDFFVSVGRRRKPGTVYQVIEHHWVKSTKNPFRFRFVVVKCPELLPDVRVSFRFVATIEGRNESVFTLIWNSRNKK